LSKRESSESPGSELTVARNKQRMSLGKDEDFHAWCLHQAETLRRIAPKVPSVDCLEIAEELEGMARSEQRALQSFLELLLIHLLKWRYQPSRRSRSWRVSIQNARSASRDELDDSPSLRARLPVLIERAYERARRSAGAEMELDERSWEETSPATCPWDFEQLMSDFWPEQEDAVEQ
jgi:Domain of unknown function DUF29